MATTRKLPWSVSTSAVCLLLFMAVSLGCGPVQGPPQQDSSPVAGNPNSPGLDVQGQTPGAIPQDTPPGQQGVSEATGQRQVPGGNQPQAVWNAPWLEATVRILHALGEFVTALLGSISWAVVALIFLIVMRERLMALLAGAVETVRDRGGSVDFWTFKVQIAEQSEHASDETRVTYSPLEFDDNDPRDTTLLKEIPAQREYPASDYVAEHWEKIGGQHALADVMRKKRSDFEKAWEKDPAFNRALPALVTYVKSLESARYREASFFADLLNRDDSLRSSVLGLNPEDPTNDLDQFRILHAVGAALAQRNQWSDAYNVLHRVTWRDGEPLYVPAGSFWLAAAYYHEIVTLAKSMPGSTLDSDEAQKVVRQSLIEPAKQLVAAMDALPAAHFTAPKGFYLREIYKDIGEVSGFVADRMSSVEVRRRLYADAELFLTKCGAAVEGEPPSPLDHNNLADLYRELGEFAEKVEGDNEKAADYYRKSHERIEVLKAANLIDPIFHDTEARLLAAEKLYGEALKVLAPYLEESPNTKYTDLLDRDPATSAENQILAAKLTVQQYDVDKSQDQSRGMALALEILEHAKAFVNQDHANLGADRAKDLRYEILELLAFAHLQSGDEGDSTINAFDQLFRLSGWPPNKTVELRARAGRALALGRRARRERRLLSYGAAENWRRLAQADVSRLLELLDVVEADPRAPTERQRPVLGLWLNTVHAIQLLAEEYFAVGAIGDAQAPAAQQLPLRLSKLHERLEPRPDGTIPFDQQWRILRRVEARNVLLRARILVALDPSLDKQDTAADIVKRLGEARGVSADLDCQTDLEESVLRLTAARLGKGDVETELRLAIEALERAVGRNAPRLRTEAIRLLEQAFVLRPGIVRRARASAKK